MGTVTERYLSIEFPEVKAVIDFLSNGTSVTIPLVTDASGERKLNIFVNATVGDQHSSEFIRQDFEMVLPGYAEVPEEDPEEE